MLASTFCSSEPSFGASVALPLQSCLLRGTNDTFMRIDLYKSKTGRIEGKAAKTMQLLVMSSTSIMHRSNITSPRPHQVWIGPVFFLD